MKVLALAIALCFAGSPAVGASKLGGVKSHRAAKASKIKTRSHVKRANKASRVKRANRSRVN